MEALKQSDLSVKKVFMPGEDKGIQVCRRFNHDGKSLNMFNVSIIIILIIV